VGSETALLVHLMVTDMKQKKKKSLLILHGFMYQDKIEKKSGKLIQHIHHVIIHL